jgi:hypothetical protein
MGSVTCYLSHLLLIWHLINRTHSFVELLVKVICRYLEDQDEEQQHHAGIRVPGEAFFPMEKARNMKSGKRIPETIMLGLK